MLRILRVCACLAASMAGCGDSGESPADKALGAKTEGDREALRELFATMEDFPHDNADCAL